MERNDIDGTTGQFDRRVKVYEADIRDEITNTPKTAKELADEHSVHTATIRKKIRRLRESGEPIIHTQDGFILIDKQWLEDMDNAMDLEKYQRFLIGQLTAVRVLAKPVRPLLPQMRRTLWGSISKEEKREIMNSCAKLVAMISFSEVEDEQ